MTTLVESKISLEFIKGNGSNLQEGIASKAKLLAFRESKGPLKDVQEYLGRMDLRVLDFYRDFQENLMDSLMDSPDLLRGISLTDSPDLLRGIITGTQEFPMGMQNFHLDFSKDSANFPQERTGPMQDFLKAPQEYTERTGSMQDFLKSPQEVMDMPEFLEFFTAALSLTEGQYRWSLDGPMSE